jgi:DNA gyrase subunit B
MNDDELWDTALNPETRRLVQVTLIEDSDEVVKAFMGKSPEKRKEFLKEVFDSAIREAEEV